MKLFIAYIEPI